MPPISAAPASPASTDSALQPALLPQHIGWTEKGQACSALWRSERGAPPPKRVVLADDTTTADSAYRLACEGTALLWRGDFQNARQLLQALARRIDKPAQRTRQKAASAQNDKPGATPSAAPVNMPSGAQAFHLHRQAQSQRAPAPRPRGSASLRRGLGCAR